MRNAGRRRAAARGASQAGFTLAEVLVAMLLMLVVLLAAAGVMTRAAHELLRARDLTNLSVLAKDKMEELRKQSFPTGAPSGDLDANVAGYFDLPAPESSGKLTYTRRWRVEPLGSGAEARFRIRVRVLSNGGLVGRARELVLETEAGR